MVYAHQEGHGRLYTMVAVENKEDEDGRGHGWRLVCRGSGEEPPCSKASGQNAPCTLGKHD